jgi:DNA-directed RNA polymerase subunit RPC12/RpoP
MKPRTKSQHLVYRLSQGFLLKLSDQQEKFAIEKYLAHVGISSKNKCTCMDCGQSFSNDLINRKRVICPNCNTYLVVTKSQKRTLNQIDYFALCEVVGEFQVFRYFKIESKHAFGMNKQTHVCEVLQHWIDENSKREVISRLHNRSYWNSSDSWTGDLEIRNKEDRRRYDIVHSFTHPDSVIKSKYRKFGIDEKMQGVSYLYAIEKIPNFTKAETLLKCRQYPLLWKALEYNGEIYRYWDSIKICIRNKHIVKDASLFIDYLELLRFFQKDLRSPKYLFPKNLKKEHDRLMDKKRLIQKRQDDLQKKKKAIQHQESYEIMKRHFFGLAFHENDLSVIVLERVEDFATEGDLLHHCIYTNEYFKKEDSLIFSGRKSDQVIETIEVSLTEMKVVQARGRNNQPTEYNSEFIKMVENNMHKIIELHKLKQA